MSADGGAVDAGLPDGGGPDAGPADAGPLMDAIAQARAAAKEAADEATQAAQAAIRAQQKAAEAAAKLEAVEAGQPAPPIAPPPTGWNGTANLSLIAFTGNATALTLSTAFVVTKIFKDGWIASLSGEAKYGDAVLTPGTPTEVTALQADGQLRGDKVFARSATVYVLGGVDTDHIDSLELREYGEPGVALYWFDRKEGDLQKLLFRTDFGMRYSNESRFQYYPNELDLGDVEFFGPRVGIAFHVAVNKDVTFIQEGEFLKDLTSTRVMVNTNTKLAAKLIKQFSMTVSFLVAYDSSPPLNRLTTDTALTAGVEMKF